MNSQTEHRPSSPDSSIVLISTQMNEPINSLSYLKCLCVAVEPSSQQLVESVINADLDPALLTSPCPRSNWQCADGDTVSHCILTADRSSLLDLSTWASIIVVALDISTCSDWQASLKRAQQLVQHCKQCSVGSAESQRSLPFIVRCIVRIDDTASSLHSTLIEMEQDHSEISVISRAENSLKSCMALIIQSYLGSMSAFAGDFFNVDIASSQPRHSPHTPCVLFSESDAIQRQIPPPKLTILNDLLVAWQDPEESAPSSPSESLLSRLANLSVVQSIKESRKQRAMQHQLTLHAELLSWQHLCLDALHQPLIRARCALFSAQLHLCLRNDPHQALSLCVFLVLFEGRRLTPTECSCVFFFLCLSLSRLQTRGVPFAALPTSRIRISCFNHTAHL